MKRWAAVPFMTCALCCSCATPELLSVNKKVGRATAEVLAELTPNRNVSLIIDVTHLMRPELLDHGATTYVVWTIRHDSNLPPHNAGALIVDDHLRGHIETVTPHRRFRLFITAEPTGEVALPRGEVLFWTDISRSG